MEVDKENIRTTRIPVPEKPLPALPKHLLREKKITRTRSPLKDLNSQIMCKPGPSKPTIKVDVDTKYVTLRRKSEDLDWQYTVFKKDSSIISVSDDESYLENSTERLNEHNKENEEIPAVTPNLKANLEPNRVKNIKRSLKRPHSRELQGLSPIVERFDDKVKRRLLLLTDSQPNSLNSPDFWQKAYTYILDRDYTEDIFDYLIAVETKLLDVPRITNTARACVINWLMRVNGAQGKASTIQTACWYLDWILGTGHVHLDKLQLVAAACYWIAQKLNGAASPASRIVRYANKAFTVEKLRSAEKIVLLRLKFPPHPIVIQDYISFLCWYFDQEDWEELQLAATFVAMCGLMVDNTLCSEYPSVIAAAAVRNALILLQKRHIGRLQLCQVYAAAVRKSSNFSYVCSILRRAVRTVSAPTYEYRAPLEHYGSSQNYLAQKIVIAANEFSGIDMRVLDQ